MKKSSFENKIIFSIREMLVIVRYNTGYIINFAEYTVVCVVRMKSNFGIGIRLGREVREKNLGVILEAGNELSLLVILLNLFVEIIGEISMADFEQVDVVEKEKKFYKIPT